MGEVTQVVSVKREIGAGSDAVQPTGNQFPSVTIYKIATHPEQPSLHAKGTRLYFISDWEAVVEEVVIGVLRRKIQSESKLDFRFPRLDFTSLTLSFQCQHNTIDILQ